MKIIFYLILVFSILSCSQKNWVDNKSSKAISPNIDSTNIDENLSKCSLYFKKMNLCLAMAWTTEISTNTSGKFLIKIIPDSSELSIENFKIVLWMPDMGHGSAPVKISLVSKNIFEISNIHFVMPGTWEIRFQIRDNKGNSEDALIKYEL